MLQQVFSDVLSVLLQQGLVSLTQVAQDGTRVRASASAPSFRREQEAQGHRTVTLGNVTFPVSQQAAP